jgi:subtilisin-like proprotein convertase family protein
MRPATANRVDDRTAHRRNRGYRQAERKARARVLALESLEPKTLLAVLPSVTPQIVVDLEASSLADITATSHDSTPTIVVNRENSDQLFAAWIRRDPGNLGGPAARPTQQRGFAAFSNNSGNTWTTVFGSSFRIDPSTTDPILPFEFTDSISAGIDGNFAWVAEIQRNGASSAGAIIVTRFDISSGNAVQLGSTTVYEWDPDYPFAAKELTMAVDDSLASFTDPDTGLTQNNPFAGNLYLAWSTIQPNVFNVPAPFFNPNTIQLASSSDGGLTFTSPVTLNDGGNNGTQRNGAPQLAVSQNGRANGPGQVTVVWDDFGSLVINNPLPQSPLSLIESDSLAAAATSRHGGPVFVPINDGADPGGGAPHTPGQTDIPINVAISDPRITRLDDLDVVVSLTHPNLSEVRLELIPPAASGLPTIVLFQNRINTAGANLGAGIGMAGGANLGPPSVNGSRPGTIFDAQAPLLSIVDRNGGATSSGYFQPEGNQLAQFTATRPTVAQVNGTWTLRITDSRFTTGAIQFAQFAQLRFSAGLRPGLDRTVATTTVVGAAAAPFPTATAATALGIAPAPSIASDNSVGSFASRSGVLYVAYVDRFDTRRDGNFAANNPADNTDIRLARSTNGGVSWSIVTTVLNDDFSQIDGGSESYFDNGFVTGRPQFQPRIAVDPVTSMVVASYLDTRDDADRSRVATYVATSTDNGNTFSPATFVDNALQPLDVARRELVRLGPLPSNGTVEGILSFGAHQGLTVHAGLIYASFSTNENGGLVGDKSLDIHIARAATAAGPRVISSTMGNIRPLTLLGQTVNATETADGTPIFDGFFVVFDRPIDRRTFGTSDITVIFRTPNTPADDPGVVVPVSSVIALDPTGPGPATNFAATSFVVRLATPMSEVGTYSYSVGPNIRDLLGLPVVSVQPNTTLSFVSTDVPVPVENVQVHTSDVSVAGFPAAEVVHSVRVTIASILHTWITDVHLSLISPSGRRVLLADLDENIFLGTEMTGAIFDDTASLSIQAGLPPYTGLFRPDQPLSTFLGDVANGTWTLEVADDFPADDGVLFGWSVEITTGPIVGTTRGNLMDQNANGTVLESLGDSYSVPRVTGTSLFRPPYDPTTLPIMIAGPRVQNAAVPGQADSPDNLVLDTSTSSINVIFDRAMDPASFTPADIVRMVGPRGLITGPFTITPVGAGPLFNTFTIGFPLQTQNGTYSIVLSPEITSLAGHRLDINQNAGLDALRDTLDPVTGATQTVDYVSTAVPVTLEPGRTVASTITVPDNFNILDLNLQLNASISFAADLSADLVVLDPGAPGGERRIHLFSNLRRTAPFANLTNTVLDDDATTLIQNGGPPFLGSFKPIEPLDSLVGSTAATTFRLEITTAAGASIGTLNSWRLIFTRAQTGTGLGEPIADQATIDFRIFNLDPTNPVASSEWVAVGPAGIDATGLGISGQSAGRISAIAIDPSDPSGNTVYIGAASGGVWKSTNFLTNSPLGPTWIPLTDFGPTFSINISAIAARSVNNDPNRSIVFAGSGEDDGQFGGSVAPVSTTTGVGFLRSLDGGMTWTLLDSTNNVDPFGNILQINDTRRDHVFVGSRVTQVVVDPRPTVTGETIIYASVAGTAQAQGLWRSLTSGRTWVRLRAGVATDLVLDPTSGPINAISNPTGNLQILYVGFQGEGIFRSNNQGGVLTRVDGGIGKPLVRDADVTPPQSIPVDAPVTQPFGANGVIKLAKPALFPSAAANADLRNQLYSGWLYAAVAGTDGSLQGLYLTKDFGRNWTRIRLPEIGAPNNRVIPSNDNSLAVGTDFAVTNGSGNFALSLLVDPNDPAIVYLGSGNEASPSTLIKVDTTGISDPHAYLVRSNNNDGALLAVNTVDPVTLTNPTQPFIPAFPALNEMLPPGFENFLNLYNNPFQPFAADSTTLVHNVAAFHNTGGDATWIPFDRAVLPDAYSSSPLDARSYAMTGVHAATAMIDPLTGRGRLLFGTDNGITSVLEGGKGGNFLGGRILGSIGGVEDNDSPGGNQVFVNGSRNGNLQIAQLYHGAAQPSQLAADAAAALGFGFGFFYGMTQHNGFPSSDPNILENGNLHWGPFFLPIFDFRGSGTDVATDPNGLGTVYQTIWPGNALTSFFQINKVGNTEGLYLDNQPGGNPDPTNWPNAPSSTFHVNPVNPDQILMSSRAGNIFATITGGDEWFVIGTPAQLGGANAYANAVVFGAPDPNDPTAATNNFIYVGTNAGQIFVTFTGGGTSPGTENWINITNGDLANNTSPVMSILVNPSRGKREAYAITTDSVYHLRDSDPSSNEVWEEITGNLFQQAHNPFSANAFGNGTLGATNLLGYEELVAGDLHAIVADWRYVIPDSFLVPNGPAHPALYVAGEMGVFRSLDNGATWVPFPDLELTGATRSGGYLPNAIVTDLDLTLGNINPTNGRPDVTTGENLLLASTYGRGAFAIRLEPIVFPNSLVLSPTAPPPSGSDSGASNTDRYTNVATPFINGLSEQTAFGNVVTINILDQTTGSPTFGQIIGTGFTDEFGRFSIQITTGDPMNPIVLLFQTDGEKTIGVQAINQSGTLGNIALLTITLDRTAPAKPAVPMLTLPSDTGTNPFGDQITRQNNNLVFQVFVTAGEPATTFVQLFRGATLVGQRSGSGTITDMNSLADGQYTYRTRQVDLAGNESEFSDNYNVRIDTLAPAAPATPALDTTLPPPNGSDTGIPGDNVTSVTRPFLRGNAERNPWENPNQPGVIQPNTVQIVDAAGNVLGSGLISDNGSYSLQPDVGLTDGIHNLRVRVLDVAGNVGATSAALQIRILSQQPGVPTIRLVEADDSGVPGDHITNVLRPRLTGMGQAGLRVEIILELGTIPGVNIGEAVPGVEPVFVQSDGTYLFQFAADLDPGTYRFRARVIDIAGNFNDSVSLNPVLQIIDSGAQLPTPILVIDPRDDTGIIDNPASGPVVTSVRRARFIAIAEPDVRIDLVNVANGQLLDSKIAGADGRALLRLPGNLVNGVIRLQARARDVAGNQGPPSNILTLRVVTTFDDYDTDGRADLANYNPTTGQFLVNRSTLGNIIPTPTIPPNLQRTDIPISADFDGDGQTDIGVFRPTTAQWIIRRSTTGVTTSFAFGAPTPPSQASPVDLPVPADFDGDGRTDLAVYRAAEGRWFVLLSGGGILNRLLGGQPGDVPVPGDYDGDFKDDIAIFRPSTATWIVRPSTGGPDQTTVFGSPNVDVPIRGDFDGDYRLDLAIWRSTTGQWQFRSSATGQVEPLVTFGLTTDIPAPADYDGDGRTDFAFLRQATTQYQIRQSSNGQTRVQNHGVTIDIPVPSPLKFRVRPPSGPVGGPSFGGDGNFNRSSSSADTGTGSIGGGFLRNDGSGFALWGASNSANNSSGGTGSGGGRGFSSSNVPSGPASSPARRASAAQLRAERQAIQNLQRAIRTARLQEDRLERRLSASGANTAAIDQALEAVHVRLETLRTRLRTLQGRRRV